MPRYIQRGKTVNSWPTNGCFVVVFFRVTVALDFSSLACRLETEDDIDESTSNEVVLLCSPRTRVLEI